MHIAMIGLGNVGAPLSFSLLSTDYLDKLSLYDIRLSYTRAVLEDLAHASTVLDRDIELEALENLSELEGADIIVITAGVKRSPDMSRRDLASINARIIREISEQIFKRNEDAFYIIITNPVDAMATIASNYLNTDRLIGSGTALDTARFRVALSRELKVNLKSISGYVAGEHGEAAVPLWSTVSVESIDLKSFLTRRNIQIDRNKIETYFKEISREILREQGGTRWGPGLIFRELIDAIAKNENKLLAFATPHYFDDVGAEVFVTIPRVLGRKIGSDIFSSLTYEEKQGIINAAKVIYKTYKKALESL